MKNSAQQWLTCTSGIFHPYSLLAKTTAITKISMFRKSKLKIHEHTHTHTCMCVCRSVCACMCTNCIFKPLNYKWVRECRYLSASQNINTNYLNNVYWILFTCKWTCHGTLREELYSFLHYVEPRDQTLTISSFWVVSTLSCWTICRPKKNSLLSPMTVLWGLHWWR